MQSWARLRTGATLAACAYAVHSLRYTLAYGSHADSELQRQGHAYLAAAPALLTALLALGAGELVRAAARGERASGGGSPLLRTWGLASVVLLAIFGIQEVAEGMFAAGHPGGVDAIVGGGGWLAAPLAAAFGLLVAVLGRGARAVLAGEAARLRPAAARAAQLTLAWPAPPDGAGRGAELWRRGRAPPRAARP
jgi:hypothetical protein